MKKLNYKCSYTPPHGSDPNFIYVASLEAVKDGFWLNDNFEFTQSSDALTWIPPSKIQYVRKVNQ